MTLRPHIRAILERTRVARAEMDRLIGVKRAKQIAAEATARAMARRKTSKLEDPRPDDATNDPADDPEPTVDGGDPVQVPARERGNAGRRPRRA